MSITITLLGTGSPLPDPHRAGPATLVQAADESYLVDAGRGVLMRLAAAGVPVGRLTAVLLTHLHSDHITDLNDVITSMWVTTFEPTPLRIVGPPGTRDLVAHLLASLGPDIGYRLAHHADLVDGPIVEVTEVDGTSADPIDCGAGAAPAATNAMVLTVAPTDHRPAEPSVAYRLERRSDTGTVAVVLAGDTVPCEGLDRLCRGADALVHTVIRKDIIAGLPIPRLQDTLDYHSSPEEAARTAARAGVGTLVLTHYVPTIPPGGGADWRSLAAAHFDGPIELGDDLHQIHVTARQECT